MNNAIHERFTAGISNPIITETFAPLDQLGLDTPKQVNDTLVERGNRYGSFVGHANVTQALKNITWLALQERNKVLSADMLEALDMIYHKIGRIINGDPNYADSWHDIAGYATLVDKRLNGVIK